MLRCECYFSTSSSFLRWAGTYFILEHQFHFKSMLLFEFVDDVKLVVQLFSVNYVDLLVSFLPFFFCVPSLLSFHNFKRRTVSFFFCLCVCVWLCKWNVCVCLKKLDEHEKLLRHTCSLTQAAWSSHLYSIFFFNQIGLIPTRLVFSLSTYSRVGHPATQGSLTLFGRNTLISSCRILCLPQQSVLFFFFFVSLCVHERFCLERQELEFFFFAPFFSLCRLFGKQPVVSSKES